jgi:SAM-dependent methyltransferase
MTFMRSLFKKAKKFIIYLVKGKAFPILQAAFLYYPKKCQCNICGWEGRRFLSDSWHEHILCPRCHSGVRQRLFIAAIQNIEKFSFDRLFHNKRILHFAPEEHISSIIRISSNFYQSADLLRQNVDLILDISNMPEVKNESFDTLIAFDVLEHVTDYKRALEEIHRILSPSGYGIFTVPQKDNLLITHEEPNIISPEERTKHFGQWDHLRIFGDDFTNIVESKGFKVTAVSESMFPESMVKRHVLAPPKFSKHPLATNYRKVFFCQKNS